MNFRKKWGIAAAIVFTFSAAQSVANDDSYTMTVTPALVGKQLVRTSLPLPHGWLLENQSIAVTDGKMHELAAARPLTWHAVTNGEPKSVRRAMVTFPYFFANTNAVKFTLSTSTSSLETSELPVKVAYQGKSLALNWTDGESVTLDLIAPSRTNAEPPRLEVAEENCYYRWERWHFPDAQWPRIVEVRSDILGQVVVVAQLQRNLSEDGRAPDFGWVAKTESPRVCFISTNSHFHIVKEGFKHSYAAGDEARILVRTNQLMFYHPAAPLKRRGFSEVAISKDGETTYRYLRCTTDEEVPIQPTSWQRAEIVIAPKGLARLTPTLQSSHRVVVAQKLWRELYDISAESNASLPSELKALLTYNRDAIVRCMTVGDDWGNVTAFSDGLPYGSYYGMNRLNHGAPMFQDGWRTGDRRLIETALLWCDNMFDQSLWWGEKRPGGTRLNSTIYEGKPLVDKKYMWRSNNSSDFCTKGYDCFFIAYEETGDPRMKQAFEAQVAYAAERVHVDKGQCRNIGDVRDFVRLYHYTGGQKYLDEALRLFRELRPKLSPENLFDQGGRPIDADPPYIEDDDVGFNVGYAKPYIIGYALGGLPELAALRLDEPRLKDTIRAVADFLCESQDPVGGWRYPHPRSSSIFMGQAIEHAWQITQAARVLGANDKYLDAIERALRQRILGWKKTGQTLNSLVGWEMNTGKVKSTKELYALYKKPADRDGSRDYAEGSPRFGGSAIEGLVYLPEVLEFYLRHRPVSQLLAEPKPEEPLGKLLANAPRVASAEYQTNGIKSKLPVFYEKLAEQMNYPLSWLATNRDDFAKWRETARAKVRETMLRAPTEVAFEPRIIASEDRGTYVARKVVFNLTGESRVLAFMLNPKGEGPFPAVLLLHDHGAKFDIGKEKVIRPWGEPQERIESARDWTEKYYSGRFIGDELAKRGYICIATDMLNWGDRGGAGSDGQQALAANLMQFGMSYAGLIAYEDLRALEFLATRGKVDTNRIAAMGLSVGGYRTWQLAALSDRIAAGVSVCWMATGKGLMVPKNNQTTGFGAFTMTHPGLANYLDYPDVASLACPKPMMFLSGKRDHLFPLASIEEAYAKMRKVWESQGAGKNLETRLYDTPHEFNAAMQDEAFAWLDAQLKKSNRR